MRNHIRKMTVTALFIAMCTVLPWVFHLLPLSASALSPMHLPVLLCGLLCGWQYGLVCGLAGPAFSALITGMPGPAYLPAMLVECAVYGLLAGLLYLLVRTRWPLVNLYTALIGAMIGGRIAAGTAAALLFSRATMTWHVFVSSYLVGTLPGIILQLLLIPLLVRALERSRLLALAKPRKA